MIPPNGAPATPPEVDEFAAGIEVPGTPVAQQPVVQQYSAASWAREHFDGLPEDLTDDSWAEHIENLQAKLDENLQKVSEYEQRIQQMALMPTPVVAQPAVPTPAAPAVETVAERKRRFEVAKIDAQLVPFLAADYAEQDERGYYKPKTMIPQVIQACDAKNRAMQAEANIAAAVTNDFYGAVDEGVYHSPAYQALLKEVQELKTTFNTTVAPLQKSAAELQHERFISQNADVLYTQDATGRDVLSQAGEMYNAYVEANIPPEQAIALAKKFAVAPQPVAPAAPVAAAPVVPAAPVAAAAPAPRFTDPIRRRNTKSSMQPAERSHPNPQDAISTSFRPTWEEVAAAAKNAQ